MPAKKSSKKSPAKRVTRAAKSMTTKTRGAVKTVRKAAVKVRKAAGNVRATTARARKIGDAAITAGAVIKQTADVVDAITQTAAKRRKLSAPRSRKSTKK